MKRLVMGISGASGIPLALTVLRALHDAQVQVHCIISQGAQAVMDAEASAAPADTLQRIANLAHTLYAPGDTAAGPASGSWQHEGMLVCPCSMASLAAIATGTGNNLIHRAADVCLKERRPLVLIPRETPLSRIHLRNMLAAHEAGAIIMPPCPAFYGRPETLDDILEHLAGRILDQLAIPHSLGHRWKS